MTPERATIDGWQLIHPQVAQELLNALRFYVAETGRPLHPATKSLIEACQRSTGASKVQPSPSSPVDRHDPDVLALTYAEAGRRLFVSESTVERLVGRGQLPAIDVRPDGSQRAIPRIRVADLDRFIDSRSVTEESA